MAGGGGMMPRLSSSGCSHRELGRSEREFGRSGRARCSFRGLGPGSLSLSLSESASLDGSGGDGVRCLVRRDARDRTLWAGEAARDPARDAARDIARLSAEKTL